MDGPGVTWKMSFGVKAKVNGLSKRRALFLDFISDMKDNIHKNALEKRHVAPRTAKVNEYYVVGMNALLK
jgi:hypothetical protein